MAMKLDPSQIMAESGGKQFGPDGKPLRSSKGAVGIAQVMEATGPEAARDAGLPWDRNKWLHDAEYNGIIGGAYQAKLERKYGGDKILATAAYNAGPTYIDRQIKKAAQTGGHWGDGLYQETRDYVKNVRGVTVGGKSNGKRSFSDSISAELSRTPDPYKVGAPKPGELDQLSALPDANSVANLGSPDTATIRQGVSDVQTAGRNYSSFLKGAVDTIHANSTAITEQLSDTADVKQSIADNMAKRNEQLATRMAGFNERKTALLDRIDEVHRMGTLDRKIKASFNADYDLGVLQGRLKQVDNQIKGHEEIYQDENQRQAVVAAATIDAGTASSNVLEAASRGVMADAQILGQVTQATSTVAANNLLPMQTEVELLKGKEIGKRQVLGTLSNELLSKAYHEAGQTPNGKLMIQGNEFTVGELQDAAQKSASQELSFISMVNAHDIGDIQHHDTMETDFINHMSPEQINVANQNGGKYNGQQLSLTKLASASQAADAMRAGQVDAVINNTAVGVADSMLKMISGGTDQAMTRATEMFGAAPGELAAYKHSVLVGMGNWQNGYRDAKARGVGNEYVRANIKEIQGYQEGLAKAVDNIAEKWGGGKPELKAVASAYMTGSPIAGDPATRGLIMLATSGMPAGSTVSGPAKAAIDAARRVVDAARSGGQIAPGADLATMFATPTKITQAELMRQVQVASGAAYADALTDQLFSTMPDIARRVRDTSSPGNIHPFARVAKEDFLAAIQHGDTEGYTAIANKMGQGIRPEDVKVMFGAGVTSPVWQQYKKAQGLTNDAQLDQLGNAMAGIQMNATLQALDASGSARPGFSPSRAYIDFLSNPQTRNEIDSVVNGYGKSNFGAFIASSAAGGGYRDQLDNYASGLQATRVGLHAKNLQQSITQQRSLMGDPFVRTGATLAASGLSKNESDLLLKAVRGVAGPMTPTPAYVSYGSRDFSGPTRQPAQQFDHLQDIIMNHKFDNPVIEKIRSRAATTWAASKSTVDQINAAISPGGE